MDTIIETIPNFSEGRNLQTLAAIRDAFETAADVILLEDSSDSDHNRSVFTAIGTPQAIADALLCAAGIAIQQIDLNHHRGKHPRIGAVDVIPLVPLKNISMDACVSLSRQIGRRLWEKYQLPVYLYEASAENPEHVNLADIRRGEFEGLARKMEQPEWRPDFGTDKPHPTAGAVVLGARKPLIAYNILLDTQDLGIAKAIARQIRESSGGFPCVKALGIELTKRGKVQVSINMTDYTVTPLYRVFDLVSQEAERQGTRVLCSELIGLAPMAALADAAAHYLKIENYTFQKVLESHYI